MASKKKYDFFIDYADSDEHWVRDVFIPILHQHGYSVSTKCDFSAGVPVLEEIESMVEEKSGKVLLIISKEYVLKTDGFISLIAQHHGLEKRTWPVIPVLIERVELPIRLRSLSLLNLNDPKYATENLKNFLLINENLTVDLDLNYYINKQHNLYAYNFVTTLTLFFIINLYFFDRAQNPIFYFLALNTQWQYVPIYGLTLGCMMSLLSYSVFYKSLPNIIDSNWLANITIPWIISVNLSQEYEKKLKFATFMLIIIFPLVANIHFWLRLDDWAIWTNCKITVEESLNNAVWQYPSLVFKEECSFFDSYRYGSFHSRKEPRQGGLSFIPLIEPIVFLIMSFFLFRLAIKCSYKILETSIKRSISKIKLFKK